MDFSKHYDAAVVGAGIAGVAAAVQAARCGKKVVLIEKTVWCGGLATTGLIYIYLPLCDGNGHQATSGIAEELLQRSMKYGPGDVYPNWKNTRNGTEYERYRNVFSPASFILALDEFLEENKVELWFDTVAASVRTEGSRLAALTVCNKSGIGEISADVFIDATGDAQLFRQCNVSCHSSGNAMAVWALEFRRGEKDPKTFGGGLGDEVFIFPKNTGGGLTGIDGKMVSRYMLESRKVLRDRYANQEQDRHDQYPLMLPAMPQLRRIWSIDAAHTLKENEDKTEFEDTIGMAGDWRKPGPVWEIPYRSLYAEKGPENLIAAGRITGAEGDVWEITRVIPTAALTGQAAGMAASLSLDSGTNFRTLNVTSLQKNLHDAGVFLRRSEIGL